MKNGPLKAKGLFFMLINIGKKGCKGTMKKQTKKIIIGCSICIAAVISIICVVVIKNVKTNNYRINREFHSSAFGEQVYIFQESDDHQEIQKTIDLIYEKQETNQFGDERYTLYFMPGNYDDIDVNVGFYTTIAGLGALPTDVKLGSLNCYARWLGTDESNHNACCNFWRSAENLEVLGNVTWAVSQATDMRRMQIDGALYLHDDYGWASGGFLADSRVEKMIDSGSQQQWLSRNNSYKVWMGENWNIVFAGDEEEGLPHGTWPLYSYTRAKAPESMREKPYLTWDEEAGYGIFLPDVREDAVGTSWSKEENCPGRLIPMSKIYVATEANFDTANLQKQLDAGKHILFTPGIYEIDQTLTVTKDDTVILGTGLATLRSADGNCCLMTDGAKGCVIAGLLFDAGTTESKTLMQIGETEDEDSEIYLSDLFFRVGGCATNRPTTTKSCVIIDADHVVGDNFWVWRADHGDQVGWDLNTAQNGIIINGDHVSMYGLMVEHFSEYQTIWNGENGKIVMYQSEIPYDVPSQDVWMAPDGRNGYASIYVNENIKQFHGIGIGIYLYNRDAQVDLDTAMVMPDAPEVSANHIITVMLNGYPGMNHVLNDAGNSVRSITAEAYVLEYCNGEWK